MKFFEKISDRIDINTAYPLRRELWKEYRVEDFDLFENCRELSFYIHIPFCMSLCKFCEYTRFKKRSLQDELNYINALENQINTFLQLHQIDKLHGFDVGGGTPTCLDDESFEKLMDLVKITESKVKKITDYEKSIEASFETINEFKIKQIIDAGFKRVSFGLQSMNKNILESNDRACVNLERIQNIFNLLKVNGINKINIDIMYGLNGLSNDSITELVEAIKILNPDQVTLYEARYNNIMIKPQGITRDVLYEQYSFLFNELTNLQYNSRFGQNTFSKFNDYGLSSYLRHRVINFIPYKGFGISAQSMSGFGLSYNNGKGQNEYSECLCDGKLYDEYIYLLPKDELVAKYIAISMYLGFFNLKIISKIINDDAYDLYKDQISYLIENKLIEITNDTCFVTQKGFKYYGAVGAMFYSKKHKKYLSGVV